MTEGRVYSNTTKLPFEEVHWKTFYGEDFFLSGEVEISYTFEKDLDDEWSLDEVEIYFIDIQMLDGEGEVVNPDALVKSRAEAYLLGHSRLNDHIDEKVYNDFYHR